MLVALRAATTAGALGEVPVGAALYDGQGHLCAVAGNRTIADCDPSAHAEVLCLRTAARALGNHRLLGYQLYVTLEPCPMCAGAIMQARLALVVYGAADPVAGSCGSSVSLLDGSLGNHSVRTRPGVLAERCGCLLREFFAARR